MSATLEPKEARDAELETQIEAVLDRIEAMDGDPGDLMTKLAILVRRRSPDQVLKKYLELRLLQKQARK
jgi:hypothetical protein